MSDVPGVVVVELGVIEPQRLQRLLAVLVSATGGGGGGGLSRASGSTMVTDSLWPTMPGIEYESEGGAQPSFACGLDLGADRDIVGGAQPSTTIGAGVRRGIAIAPGRGRRSIGLGDSPLIGPSPRV